MSAKDITLTNQWPPRYMLKRGKKLAAANKACKGVSNKDGGFYRCVKRKLKK